jgi:hypothetical protein
MLAMTAPLLTPQDSLPQRQPGLIVPSPAIALAKAAAAGIAVGAVFTLEAWAYSLLHDPGSQDLSTLPLLVAVLTVHLMALLAGFTLWARGHRLWLLGGIMAGVLAPLSLVLGHAWPLGLGALGLLLAALFARLTPLGAIAGAGAAALVLVLMLTQIALQSAAGLIVAVVLSGLAPVLPVLLAPAPQRRLSNTVLIVSYGILPIALVVGVLVCAQLVGRLQALLPGWPAVLLPLIR